MNDRQFFQDHQDRQCRIREPNGNEKDAEFKTLGPHERSRRKVIVWKVPFSNPMAPGQIVCIPFLTFADESIADDDTVLLPLLSEMMAEAAASYGISIPKIGHA